MYLMGHVHIGLHNIYYQDFTVAFSVNICVLDNQRWLKIHKNEIFTVFFEFRNSTQFTVGMKNTIKVMVVDEVKNL